MNQSTLCGPWSMLLLLILTGCSDSGDSSAPNFTKNIAPILFQNCAVCHRPGEAAPFSLLSYEDARKRAGQIADVTESRYMPPWLPEPGHAEFADERRLSAEQIAMIRQWDEQGAVQGDPVDLPPVPKWTEGWQLGEPDLVISMPEPYTLPPEGTDVFRHFAIPIPIKTTRYVRGFEFRPGNAKIVHHARMLLDQTGTVRQLDERDPEPGFLGDMRLPEIQTPAGHFLGWTPGKQPVMVSEDIVWRLHPGTDLYLELHMLPTGKPESIQSSLGLYFTDKPPQRDPVILRLGPHTIDIPPGKKDYTIEDEYELPVDVDVRAVYAHGHLLCRDMKGFAVRPDGTKERLLWIGDWNFDWQDEYRYAAPIFLPKGTTLHMKFTYDNSSENDRNPTLPPKRVFWGERTSDEMGDLWFQVLPRNSDDRTILVRDFGKKELDTNIRGYEYNVQVNPSDATAHYNLGAVLGAMGKLGEAQHHFEQALQFQPDFLPAQMGLGKMLRLQGKLDEAIALYHEVLRIKPDLAEAHGTLGFALYLKGNHQGAMNRYLRALELKPDYASVHINLARLLRATGSVDEAISHLRQAIQIQSNVAAHTNLGNALASQGKLDDAIGCYRQALEIQPDSARVLTNLGSTLGMQGKIDEAIAHFRQALKIKPGDIEAKRNLRIARQQKRRRGGGN